MRMGRCRRTTWLRFALGVKSRVVVVFGCTSPPRLGRRRPSLIRPGRQQTHGVGVGGRARETQHPVRSLSTEPARQFLPRAAASEDLSEDGGEGREKRIITYYY